MLPYCVLATSVTVPETIYLFYALSKKYEYLNYNYVYEYQFKVPATSSEKIIFYKSDNTQDYSYPNNNNSSAVNVSVKLAGETS